MEELRYEQNEGVKENEKEAARERDTLPATVADSPQQMQAAGRLQVSP